jgi:hypothetical protein
MHRLLVGRRLAGTEVFCAQAFRTSTVAQKLPLYAKRIDEDLKARADQEIKRFS